MAEGPKHPLGYGPPTKVERDLARRLQENAVEYGRHLTYDEALAFVRQDLRGRSEGAPQPTEQELGQRFQSQVTGRRDQQKLPRGASNTLDQQRAREAEEDAKGEEPSGLRALWQGTEGKRWAIALGLASVLAIAGIVVALTSGDDNSGPAPGVPPAQRSQNDPKTLVEEIAQRSIWTELPTTFKSANQVRESDAALELDYDYGPEVYTVDRIIREGGDGFQNSQMIFVGRVASVVPRSYEYARAYNRELRLVGFGEGDIYVAVAIDGIELVDVAVGVVAAIPGEIAAIGQTEDDEGVRHQSVYVAGGVQYDILRGFYDAGQLRRTDIDSRKLRSALRRYLGAPLN